MAEVVGIETESNLKKEVSMQRCPTCKKFTLEEYNALYKKCYNPGCTTRVYPDGSVSRLFHETDKIRRIKIKPDGSSEIISEFRYPSKRKGRKEG